MGEDNKGLSERRLDDSSARSETNYESSRPNQIREVIFQGPRSEYIDETGFITDTTCLYFG